MKKLLITIYVTSFVALLFAVPMSPALESTLRTEGTLNTTIEILQEAKRKGVDAPNPNPVRFERGERVTLQAIAILVDFDDNVGTTPVSHYDSLLSSLATYPSGSFRDFYLENSYNNVDLIITVVGWLRMPETYAYYVDGQYGFGSYPRNAQRLAEDAVWAADPQVDFSQFDNDSNGVIDALFIVHAGPGAEQSGDPNDIWSHAWVTNNVPYVDSVYAYPYSTEPENGRIGVFCHEAGHAVFGLPDLYDYDYDSYGVGRWSLMAGGSWNGSPGGTSPAHLDAWCKIQAGFVTPQIPTSNQTGVIFPRVEDNQVIYKLWTSGAPGQQFFLVENRQKTGFDYYLPGSGLMIYHVDEAQSGNNYQWYPGHTTSGHYLVAVEQADGLWELEKNINAGNAGDPYPGSSNNRALNDTTVPDSKDYNFNTTYVAVENISDSGDTMTADIRVTTIGVEEVSQSYAQGLALRIAPSIGRRAFTISFGTMLDQIELNIKIFDALGRQVKSFSDVNSETSLTWHADNDKGEMAPPGVYFVQLTTRPEDDTAIKAKTHKIILLK